MGAVFPPTFSCRSTTMSTYAGNLGTLEPDAGLLDSSFVYTPAEWRVQFLERPHAEIECIGVDGRAAVVERTSEFDRVHAVSDERLLPSLIARAHACGRRLFWY